ncbi:MAG: D-alanine--D-alanine ligase [Clostridia bacterium]|nr:D-alanine--D-alanine ligase [Clostridia bacterium]
MTVALIFGGKSSEHSVSVATATLTFDALNSKYDVIPVYIDKNGVWRKGKKNVKPTLKKLRKGKKVRLGFSSPYLYCGLKKIRIDCAFLCLHGANGEDGTVQGALKLASIPFTGCDVTASSVGMDKIFAKDVFVANKLPCIKHISITKEEYVNRQFVAKSRIRMLGYPVIIKPANAGSSIGISIAKSSKSVDRALETAFRYDNRIIVEKALTDFREFNCAVIKSEERFYVSDIEEPYKKGEILDYIDKYSDSGTLRERNIPAKIDKEIAENIRELALKTFRVLNCSGVARIDFLQSSDGTLYVNEINTIPGSMAFYLFVCDPISPERLCELLIDDALYNHKRREELSYTYQSEIFATKS